MNSSAEPSTVSAASAGTTMASAPLRSSLAATPWRTPPNTMASASSVMTLKATASITDAVCTFRMARLCSTRSLIACPSSSSFVAPRAAKGTPLAQRTLPVRSGPQALTCYSPW